MASTLGLRHAVLYVSDPALSARFYHEALGLEPTVETADAVFMSSPLSGTDHDLGLFRAKPGGDRQPGQLGLYHLSWEVATLAELAAAKEQLAAKGALVGENNHGVSRSLYCQDPDGHEFEIMWEVPLDLYDPADPSGVPLDLEADMARWGPDHPGRGA